MSEIGRWNNLRFEVSPSVIRSFNELQIRASINTDTVEDGGSQYEKRKNQKPIEISLTVQLHAGLGYDVQSEANAFVQAALFCNASYFYIGSKKLVACPLMLTEATISNVEISAGGTWTKADIALTMKQASPMDGTKTTSASGTGSSGPNNVTKDIVAAATKAAQTVANAGTAAAKALMNSIINNAKKTSIAVKAGSSTTRVAMKQ